MNKNKTIKVAELKRAFTIAKAVSSDLNLISMILKENQMVIAERSVFVCHQNIAILLDMVFDEINRVCNEEGQTIQAYKRSPWDEKI